MRDNEIIQYYLKRDERGIAETRDIYGERLIRIAENLLSREDAEECVSDVYLTMWNNIPPDAPEYLLAYAVRILRNLAMNRIKASNAGKRRAELVGLTDAFADILPDPNADTEEEAILRVSDTLNRFLGRQTRKKRDIFILYYWYGKSMEDIAVQYAMSYAGVRKLLYRMQREVKRAVKEE